MVLMLSSKLRYVFAILKSTGHFFVDKNWQLKHLRDTIRNLHSQFLQCFSNCLNFWATIWTIFPTLLSVKKDYNSALNTLTFNVTINHCVRVLLL